MSTDYLPKKDADLDAWATHLTDKLVMAPLMFGISESQATAVQNLAVAFTNALAASTNPSQQGRATVQAKNFARKALVEAVRRVVKQVQAAPGTTDTMRGNLGITIPKHPSRQSAPASIPNLDILRTDGRTISFRAHDGSGSRRGKPADVTSAVVFTYVGDVPPANVDEWVWRGQTGKTLESVTFDAALPPGTTVWITAAWQNARGTGPAAEPVSRTFGAASLNVTSAAARKKSAVKLAA